MTDSDENPSMHEVTVALQRLADGDAGASGELYQLLRKELHALAGHAMRRQPTDHTLQTTALVNEAWLRLARTGNTPPSNRRHFLGVVSKAMRSILVDHARSSKSEKRGGHERRTELPQEVIDVFSRRALDLIELDDALERLAVDEPRLARVVELRFFAGLTIEETASVLELGTSTVERDWHLARIWLRRELAADP